MSRFYTDVDCVDSSSYTPLLHAATEGHWAVVNLLLAIGAKVNVEWMDNYDMTPLHAATSMGHYLVCAALLDHGAETSRICFGDWTPSQIAEERGYKVIELLLRAYGAGGAVMEGSPM
ncbi:hypothetical protein FE257_005464 [Aspergillus nanangensis]|uniref:Ankyrin n=1 Tax=Aspergillus nanangensis TaxID=2582783 RepID=A0AAD4CR50_ASPNN|nr:hypothetical protein FE257_005464 [Aspergillus nanangensis]